MRTYDINLVANAITSLSQVSVDFDPQEWINDSRNIALVVNDDIALFHYEKPGVVNGHYYFKSRGRSALTAGQRFLEEIWKDSYGIQTILGLTPLGNLGARWMSRQLGFTSHGVVSTTIGPHEIFIMHRAEHEAIMHRTEYDLNGFNS